MFRNLRLKREPERNIIDPGSFTTEQLAKDASIPISIQQINHLPENTKRRIYRSLIPPALLTRFKIDPLSWKGTDGGSSGSEHIHLTADPDTSMVNITVRSRLDHPDDYFCLELSDNFHNGIDLNLILLSDPETPRFNTDVDAEGRSTLFGTARRNLSEEERALRAGLAPGQTRSSLGASSLVLQHLESFILALGHRAYFLEPLTYASAWIFERRGFAYVRGHKLMDDIQREFQPGGRLHQALDGSTPFRDPDAWCTVRGRAWAIQDGILEAIGARWDGLRMVKQVGRSGGVETFPGAIY